MPRIALARARLAAARYAPTTKEYRAISLKVSRLSATPWSRARLLRRAGGSHSARPSTCSVTANGQSPSLSAV